jgi:predicted alpha/beta-fold hydrolase
LRKEWSTFAFVGGAAGLHVFRVLRGQPNFDIRDRSFDHNAMIFRAEDFHAPWWLRSPHAQTIGARLLRRRKPQGIRRERVITPDEDFLDLDFSGDFTNPRAIVLLQHGLEGSALRGYALNMYHELSQYGIPAVGLNFRSCSGELNRAKRLYHSGETEDTRFVVRLLDGRYPRAAIGAIGFSLGGNALLKYLGEEGSTVKLKCAVAVSVPYDLGAGADYLDQSVMGRFYTGLFVKALVEKSKQKAELIAESCDFVRGLQAKSFREFDDAITAPLHGFAHADDYYERSSSAQFLPHIRVPTLLLHSEDDPFLPRSAIPYTNMKANPQLKALVTDSGGHVGFIHGSPIKPQFWAEATAARFLADCLGQHAREQ